MTKKQWLIIGVFLALYILPLGFRPLVIPDESRYAEIPREMLASGNWVVPRLDGLRYFEKPVLGYWLNGMSMLLFGQNNFAVRIPSALAAGLSALLLFYLIRRGRHEDLDPLVPPIIFLSSLEVFFVGTFAVLDSMFSLFLTATMVFLFLALQQEKRSERYLFYALAGAASGCSFMTKGFLAFAIPGVALLPYLIWKKRLWSFLANSWVPLLTLLATVSPWVLAVHAADRDFLDYFFWVEHVQRFASSKAQHAKPFWFYIPVLLIGMLPWTILIPPLLRKVKSAPPSPSLYHFALCWFIFPFILLSIARGKLQTYILPCFAPLSLLISCRLQQYFSCDNRGGRLSRWAVITGAIMLLAAVALPINHYLNLSPQTLFRENESWKMWLAVLGAVSFGILSFLSARTADSRKALAICAASPLLFYFSFNFIVPEHIKGGHTPAYFFDQLAGEIPRDALLISNERLVHAAAWHFKRSDISLLGKEGELSYGLRYAPSRLLDATSLNSLLSDPLRTRQVVLLLHTKTFNQFRDALPTPKKMKGDENFTLAVY